MSPLRTGILTLIGIVSAIGLAVGALALLDRWFDRRRATAATDAVQGAKPAEPFLSYDDVWPQPPIRHVHVYRGGGWHGPKRTDADFDQLLADCLAEQEQTGDETR